MSQSRPVSVFIAHCSHGELHAQEAIIALSGSLRRDGLDANLDHYEVSPPIGWPSWLQQQISSAQFVIVACTERLHAIATVPGTKSTNMKGLWQWKVVEEQLATGNEKFIPIILRGTDQQYIPSRLQHATSYCVESEEGYLDLYRHLTCQPKFTKPPLGVIKKLPATDFNVTIGGYTLSSAVQEIGLDVVERVPQRELVEGPTKTKSGFRKVLDLLLLKGDG